MTYSDRARLESSINQAYELVTTQEVSVQNQAWIAQIMTIWVSGYIEATCKDILNEFSKNGSNPKVFNYVNWHLNRFQNPKMERILELVSQFDDDLAIVLREFSDGPIKESVNSVVGVRHRIAHGNSANISVGRIMGYFKYVKRLANKLEELFD